MSPIMIQYCKKPVRKIVSAFSCGGKGHSYPHSKETGKKEDGTQKPHFDGVESRIVFAQVRLMCPDHRIENLLDAAIYCTNSRPLLTTFCGHRR